MKKGVIFIILLIILFSTIPLVTAQGVEIIDITGDVAVEIKDLTGDVSKGTNVSVEIITTAIPSLSLIRPINSTYFQNNSIPLEFTVSDQDNIWYNLDNGDNITVNRNTTFGVSEGSHELFLFANNSFGTVQDNVTFSVNISFLTIIYGEFNASSRGDSIDFNNLSLEELQNLTELILEDSRFGLISFNEGINVTDDLNITDGVIDLDSFIEISRNSIFLSSNALIGFNRSATLYLYGLTFNDPRILLDGEECPDTICTEQSYSGGTLIFNVTHFTTYSSEEGAQQFGDAGGGGGGTAVQGLSVSPKELRVQLIQGKGDRKSIVLHNTGNVRLNIDLRGNGLSNFLTFPEGNTLVLDANEKRVVAIDFEAAIDTEIGVFTGFITIKAYNIEELVKVIIEVESAELLFDIELFVPE